MYFYMNMPNFVYPFISWWTLELFPLLDIMSNTSVNIHVQVLWIRVFCSLGYVFGYIPRSGIAGSHGNSVFNFLRNCQTVLQNGCTNFFQWRGVGLCQVLFAHLLRWSCGFCPYFIDIWCITWIDFQMLNQPCTPGLTPIQSCYIILSMCCWIWSLVFC